MPVQQIVLMVETHEGAGAARFLAEGVPQGSLVETILLGWNRFNLNFDGKDYFFVLHGVVVERLGFLRVVVGDEFENVGI